MAGSLGTISGRVRLDVSQAIAGFAAVRAASAQTSGTMAAAGTRMSGAGKVMLGVGVGMVAAFGMAVNAAADFEKKMDYFGAVNNATADQMEVVRQKALELGQTTQFSASQIADAFVEMGKAGVSVTDITGGLADAIVNMASAADIKLDEATNIVTSQIQAYGLAAKDAAHITDELAGAANASIVDVSDLGVSLKYVGGVAHSLGINFDDTIDALSLLGKAGIKGSTAGTSLRQIMVSLAGGTDKAKSQLKELGIITADGTNLFFDAHGKAKSLAQVFQILQDHTQGLSQKEQLMAFRTIFNNRALAAAEILTKQGAKGFAEMNGEISKTTAADVAAKRMDNLSGDIQKLKSSIQTLMIEAGTPFQSFLRGIVQGLTRLVRAFGNMPAGVQKAIMIFLLVGGVALILMGSIALIGGTVLKFISVIKSTWAAMKILVTAFRAVTVATWEMTAAALANPYVWIVIAVIALVVALVLLYKRSETFRNAMKAMGRALKTAFLAVVDWFKGLPKWFGDRWKEISNWFKIGINWVKKNWDILLAIFLGPIGVIILVWRRFGDDIVNFFASIPGAISSFFSNAISAVIDFAKKLPYYIGFALGFVLGTIVRFGIAAGTAIYNWVTSSYNAVVTWFQKLPGRIATFFTSLYTWFINWSIAFGLAIVNWVVSSYNSTVTWFQKLPGRIANFFIDLWHRSQAAWTSFRHGLVNWLISAYNSTIEWFQKLPGRVYNFFVSMKNRAVGALISMVASASTMGSRVYHGLMNWINRLPSVVSGIVGRCISAFNSMVSRAASAASNFAKGLWDGFKSGLGIHSPSYIERAMWAITSVTDEESKKLGTQVRTMQGMAGTIAEQNPGRAASELNTTTLTNMTRGMAVQAAILRHASNTLFPGGQRVITRASAALGLASSTSSTVPGQAGSERNINVQVFNPVAEKASDSTARKLRQLSDMGAL